MWNGQFKRDLFCDTDGSLTGTGKKTWITKYYPHLITK